MIGLVRSQQISCTQWSNRFFFLIRTFLWPCIQLSVRCFTTNSTKVCVTLLQLLLSKCVNRTKDLKNSQTTFMTFSIRKTLIEFFSPCVMSQVPAKALDRKRLHVVRHQDAVKALSTLTKHVKLEHFKGPTVMGARGETTTHLVWPGKMCGSPSCYDTTF